MGWASSGVDSASRNVMEVAGVQICRELWHVAGGFNKVNVDSVFVPEMWPLDNALKTPWWSVPHLRLAECRKPRKKSSV